jgi:hypothetical protein
VWCPHPRRCGGTGLRGGRVQRPSVGPGPTSVLRPALDTPRDRRT